MRFAFGKFSGCEVSAVPEAYLVWCLAKVTDLDPELRDEIRKQLGLRPAKQSLINKQNRDTILRRFTRIFQVDADEECVEDAVGVLTQVLDGLNKKEKVQLQIPEWLKEEVF